MSSSAARAKVAAAGQARAACLTSSLITGSSASPSSLSSVSVTSSCLNPRPDDRLSVDLSASTPVVPASRNAFAVELSVVSGILSSAASLIVQTSRHWTTPATK